MLAKVKRKKFARLQPNYRFSVFLFFKVANEHALIHCQSQEQNVVRLLQQAGFSEQQQIKQSIADN